MSRFLAPIACTLLSLGGPASAFEVRATLKRVDADQNLLQFTAGQQDRTAHVAADAKILDRQGSPLEGGLKAEALRPGALVTLTVERVDEKPLIRAIRLGGGPAPAQPAGARTAEFHPPDTSSLVPLTDLGDGKYRGFEGGLYPGGENRRPERHEAAGLALAAQVRPLDAEGRPSPEGKVVLLGIGFSNTVQAFNGFMSVARKDPGLNRRLVLVNGAVGGMSAEMVQQAESGRGAQYWSTVDDRLKAAGVARPQVQAVWIKETNPTAQGASFPKDVQDLHAQLVRIVRLVHARFPNARLAYLSSRTYGGWARPRPDGRGPGNSEPYSYESAFAVKWLIDQQLKGDPTLNFDADRGPVEAPWLSWGPYLWANGETPRRDGFRFHPDDFMENDRMHESPSGRNKIGGELLRFFKTDPTTRTWFLEP